MRLARPGIRDDEVGVQGEGALHAITRAARPAGPRQIHIRRPYPPDNLARHTDPPGEQGENVGNTGKTLNDVGPLPLDKPDESQEKREVPPASCSFQVDQPYPRGRKLGLEQSSAVELGHDYIVAAPLETLGKNGELSFSSSRREGGG